MIKYWEIFIVFVFFGLVAIANADQEREVIASSPELASVMLRDLKEVSRVSEINPGARAGYAKNIDALAEFASRAIRWRVVNVNTDAIAVLKNEGNILNGLDLKETFTLTLFSDVVVEIKILPEQSVFQTGDHFTFKGEIAKGRHPLDPLNEVHITIRSYGTLKTSTVYFDDGYYSIYPLLDFPGVNRKGNSPHLVIQFDPYGAYSGPPYLANDLIQGNEDEPVEIPTHNLSPEEIERLTISPEKAQKYKEINR